MATTVTLNGTSYSVPATQDSGWGPSLSSYLIALSSGVLTKSGGTFTLTADANFGATFGLISKYFTSASANPATAGVVRLANGDSVSFRNSGNTADLALKPSSTDGILQYNSVDLADVSSSQTLTNKTIDGNSNTISNVSDSALGTSYVKADGSRALSANWAAGAFSITANGVVVGSAANTVSGVSTLVNGTGTLTLPTTTDTLVGQATTDTLTNKTIDGGSNTLTSIGDSSLSVSYLKADGSRGLSADWAAGSFSITANGVILGSASNKISGVATIGNDTATLTLPTTTDTLVGRDTTDTLTNKTLVAGSTSVVDGTDNTKTFVLDLSGNTTGVTTTLAAQNSADSTLSLPAVTTDTLVSRTSTDTGTSRLKNKDVEAGTFAVVDGTDTTKKFLFDASSNTTGHTLTLKTAYTSSNSLFFPVSAQSGDSIVARQSSDTGTSRLKNKDLDSSTVKFVDSTDTTKIVKFDVSGNSAAQVTTIVSQSTAARSITLPDATDTLVGQETTDTLTNKTFGDAPTFEHVSTPSTPSSGFSRIYPKSDGKFYTLDSNGTETVVGSGSGGTKNYITTGDFENQATTGWSLAHSSQDTSFNPTSTATAGSAFSSSSGGTEATKIAINIVTDDSVDTTGTLTNNSNEVTSVADTTGIVVGMMASCATSGFVDGSFVIGISGTTVYLSQKFTGTTSTSQSITFSSKPLAGKASLAYTTNSTDQSRPGSTGGDMLISDACTIDKEDQAKVLAIKFYYENNAGSSISFDGTNQGAFGVYIYDIDNAAWIQPAGVYNLVQGSGVGVYTGTFQTPANMTQFQLALVSLGGTGVNTPFNIYLDDFFVGPQTTVNAPAMSDIGQIPWSPTIGGANTAPSLGSGTTIVSKAGRSGDKLLLYFNLDQTAAGTAGSGTYLIPIPSGLSIDATKVTLSTNPAIASVVGQANLYTAPGSPGTNAQGIVYAYSATQLAVEVGAPSWGSIEGSLSNAAVYLAFNASVPIAGWSSNTVSSADTDTRVISASYQTIGNAINSTPAIVKFSTQLFDRSASYSTSTGLYTVPVSGDYRVSACVRTAAATWSNSGIALWVYKNGAVLARLGAASAASGTVQLTNSGSQTVSCNAGDTLAIYAASDVSTTLSGTASDNTLSIERLSGPAVVQSVESINARYTTSGTSVAPSAAAKLTWDTKTFDSHNAMNASSQYVAGVSGKYKVKAYAEAPMTNGSVIRKVLIYKNGASFSEVTTVTGVSSTYGQSIEDTVPLNSGDYIEIYVYHNDAGNQTFNTNSYVAIERVGN